jgi:hypothetical protein
MASYSALVCPVACAGVTTLSLAISMLLAFRLINGLDRVEGLLPVWKVMRLYRRT